MARQVRVEYGGAYYHVMARGDRREVIFEDDDDRRMFLRTQGEVCERSGWRIHAWVLMRNHYHWVLETPEANLVEGMRWFQLTYTRRYNLRHRQWGHLFGGRYKAVVVEADGRSTGDYLGTLLDYVHLNPVRAGMVEAGRGKGLLAYPWSSLAQGYAVESGKREAWMETRVGFELAGRKDTATGRRLMIEDLERRAAIESAEDGKPAHPEGQTLNSTLQRGWYWGSQEFKERMLKLIGGKEPASRRREQKRLHGEEAAGKLVEEGMRHFQLKEADLKRLPGSDPRKIAMARAVARRTNVRQKWVAERLNMGSASNVSQQQRRFAALPRKKVSAEIRKWLELVNCL